MSKVKINFDSAGNIETPSLVLSYRSGKKIGALMDVQDLVFADGMDDIMNFTFSVNKKNCPYWEKIKDFYLLWVPDWDKYYEIKVITNQNYTSTKTVYATHLPEAELSQLKLYDIEINTDDDIDTDDYQVSVLYNRDNPKASILNRMMEKAVNFTIVHVDDTICNIDRSFSFNDISLLDAFNEIAEEINCYFEYDSYTDRNTGEIVRAVSVYDLESTCVDCGYRGEFTKTCPNCGSENVNEGYGENTSIFFSIDNVLDDVTYETDVDSVKNCFRLEAGDDLMTAAVIASNPNGSQYIWYISEDAKEGMSVELVEKINSYDEMYLEYSTTKNYGDNIDFSEFNILAEKYTHSLVSPVTESIVGYSSLMNVLYDTIDMELYLESGLMPSIEIDMDETTAEEQACILENSNAWSNGIAIENLDNNPSYLTETTVESVIEKMAKVVVDPRYKVTAVTDDLDRDNKLWSGSFIVENYSSDEDIYPLTGTGNIVTISITGDYETFVKQRIDMALAKGDDEDYSISGLFKLNLADFKNELKKYGLSSLEIFLDSCQTAIDILIEQGVGNATINDDDEVVPQLFDGKDLYNAIYVPYTQKLDAIQDEIAVREDEIAIVTTLQSQIEDIQNEVHEALNFETYLKMDTNGELTQTQLWKEFNSFRREDTYQNSNYISDGLSNADIFRNAEEFIAIAEKEIKKSATLQHSISSTLKNLLTIKEFNPLWDNFEVGNWIRIEVDDEIYKLRLLSYEIDFNNYENMNIVFSDVVSINGDMSDVRQTLKNAKSIASSYSSTQRQASKGEAAQTTYDDWVKNGLDATAVKIINSADNEDVVYDRHGMLFRKLDEITNEYDPRQTKIVSGTMAITDDNWNTVKTAVGRFFYEDPVTHELTEGYGVNAEVLIGKLILGQKLGLYNDDASMVFDQNGLKISNDVNTFVVDPNSNDGLLKVLKNNGSIMYLNDDGDLMITGIINALRGGTVGGWNIEQNCFYTTKTQLSDNITRTVVLQNVGGNLFKSSATKGNNCLLTANGKNIVVTPQVNGNGHFVSSLSVYPGTYHFRITDGYNAVHPNDGEMIISYEYADDEGVVVGVELSNDWYSEAVIDTLEESGHYSIYEFDIDVGKEQVDENQLLELEISYSMNAMTLGETYEFAFEITITDGKLYDDSGVVEGIPGNAVLCIKRDTGDAVDLPLYITNDGYVYMNNIFADGGTIGGFTIEDNGLYTDTLEICNKSIALGGHGVNVGSQIIFYSRTSRNEQTSLSPFGFETGMQCDDENYHPLVLALPSSKNGVCYGYFSVVSRDNRSGNEVNSIKLDAYEGNITTTGCIASTSQHNVFQATNGGDAYVQAQFGNDLRVGNFGVAADGRLGIYDQTNGNFVLYSGTNQTVNIPHPLSVTNTITCAGATVSVSGATNAYLIVQNGSRKGCLGVSSGYNLGIWDTTNNSWMIYSDTAQNVQVPHLFFCRTYGSVNRVPIGSDLTDKNRVAQIASYSSTINIWGQWGTAGSTPSARSLSVPSSDIRLKDNVQQSEVDALNVINRIQMRQFDWKDRQEHWDVGFVADELEQIDPLLSIGGGTDEDGNLMYKSVNDFYLLGYLTKAVQELSAENAILKTDLENIKKENTEIKDMLQKLLSKIA